MHREKNLAKKLAKEEQPVRRTTIILERDERDFVDELINQGKEKGIKPLFSKMLEIYKALMISDWNYPGEYYCGISRVALTNIELIDVLVKQIPREKWKTTGEKMGSALRVSLEATLGIKTHDRDSWEEVFDHLKIQGLGEVSLRDRYLLVKTPFLTSPEIWAGLFETLLNIEVTTKNEVPPLVYEIEE